MAQVQKVKADENIGVINRIFERDGCIVIPVFLRAIIGLHPKQIGHLVALLKWLEIIPRESESGKPATSEKDPGSNGAGKT